MSRSGSAVNRFLGVDEVQHFRPEQRILTIAALFGSDPNGVRSALAATTTAVRETRPEHGTTDGLVQRRRENRALHDAGGEPAKVRDIVDARRAAHGSVGDEDASSEKLGKHRF